MKAVAPPPHHAEAAQCQAVDDCFALEEDPLYVLI